MDAVPDDADAVKVVLTVTGTPELYLATLKPGWTPLEVARVLRAAATLIEAEYMRLLLTPPDPTTNGG